MAFDSKEEEGMFKTIDNIINENDYLDDLGGWGDTVFLSYQEWETSDG